MRANQLVDGRAMVVAIIEAVMINQILSVAGLDANRIVIVIATLIEMKRVSIIMRFGLFYLSL